MTAIQIADGCQDFAQLTGNGGFTCTWVTSKNNVHRHFLLLAQSTLGALHGVLYRVGHLFYGGLNLVHTNVAVQIAQDILNRALLGYITRDVAQLYPCGIGATTDILGKDILGCFIGQVSVTKGLVLNLNLIFKETQ